MNPSPPDRTDPRAGGGTGEPRPQAGLRRASKLLGPQADPHRLEILRTLGDGPKSVPGVSGGSPVAPDQLVKRHLVRLRLGGLVEGRVAGGSRICRSTETGRRAIRALDGYHPR